MKSPNATLIYRLCTSTFVKGYLQLIFHYLEPCEEQLQNIPIAFSPTVRNNLYK